MNSTENPGLSRRTLLQGGSLFGGGLYLALGAPRPLAAAAAQAGGVPAQALGTERIAIESRGDAHGEAVHYLPWPLGEPTKVCW